LAVPLEKGVLANDSDPNGDVFTAVPDTDASRGALSLNAEGSFSYTPDPGVCNRSDTFKYRATDGELFSGPTAVAITVQTPRDPTTLTLRRSATEVVYGRSVLLTARLSAHSPSAVLSVYGTPAGGATKLLKRGPPDADGRLSVRLEPTRRTSFEARSTDNCYLSGDTAAKIVEVAPRVEGHMVGFFDRRGAYALYHAGGRAPKYRDTVTPDHSGGPVTFVWQRLRGGSWRTYLAQKTHLNDNSSIDVSMVSGVVRGVKYRVRIVVPPDRTHLAGVPPWTYFEAV
jgi:VCBS repeat-containing protein